MPTTRCCSPSHRPRSARSRIRLHRSGDRRRQPVAGYRADVGGAGRQPAAQHLRGHQSVRTAARSGSVAGAGPAAAQYRPDLVVSECLEFAGPMVAERGTVPRPVRSPELIGRDDELAACRAAVRAAGGGHGAFLRISGEAGIGKEPTGR